MHAWPGMVHVWCGGWTLEKGACVWGCLYHTGSIFPMLVGLLTELMCFSPTFSTVIVLAAHSTLPTWSITVHVVYHVQCSRCNSSATVSSQYSPLTLLGYKDRTRVPPVHLSCNTVPPVCPGFLLVEEEDYGSVIPGACQCCLVAF